MLGYTCGIRARSSGIDLRQEKRELWDISEARRTEQISEATGKQRMHADLYRYKRIGHAGICPKMFGQRARERASAREGSRKGMNRMSHDGMAVCPLALCQGWRGTCQRRRLVFAGVFSACWTSSDSL